mmetsp:Transcript_129134/g.373804  ORF Transcript_129134/g.373804 Transcript_129134/m.373804 type:complete len:433 (-) Transcript_129134:1265-2563(-)
MQPEPRHHHRVALTLDPLHQQRGGVGLQSVRLVCDCVRVEELVPRPEDAASDDHHAPRGLLLVVVLLPLVHPLPLGIKLHAEDADRARTLPAQLLADGAARAQNPDVPHAAGGADTGHQPPIIEVPHVHTIGALAEVQQPRVQQVRVQKERPRHVLVRSHEGRRSDERERHVAAQVVVEARHHHVQQLRQPQRQQPHLQLVLALVVLVRWHKCQVEVPDALFHGLRNSLQDVLRVHLQANRGHRRPAPTGRYAKAHAREAEEGRYAGQPLGDTLTRESVQALEAEGASALPQDLPEPIQLFQRLTVHGQKLHQREDLIVERGLHTEDEWPVGLPRVESAGLRIALRHWHLDVLHHEEVDEGVAVLVLVHQQVHDARPSRQGVLAERVHRLDLFPVEGGVAPRDVWLQEAAVPADGPIARVPCDLLELGRNID